MGRCGEGAVPRGALRQEVEEQLDLRGVATDGLRHWRLVEERCLKRYGKRAAGLKLGLMERTATLAFVEQCVRAMEMMPRESFQVAALLDAVLVNAPVTIAIGSLPVVVVALAVIRKKVDDPFVPWHQYPIFELTGSLAANLRKMGHEVPQATRESILGAERDALTALQWQVELPSVQSWLEMYRLRFCALAGGFGELVKPLWQECCATGIFLAGANAASLQVPPRVMAMGLLDCSFRRRGLLPAAGPDEQAVPTHSSIGAGPSVSEAAQEGLQFVLLHVVDASVCELLAAGQHMDRMLHAFKQLCS